MRTQRNLIQLALLTVGLVLAMIGCTDKKAAETRNDKSMAVEPKESMNSMSIKEQYKDFRKAYKVKLEKVESNIAAAEKKIEETTGDVKDELSENLEELKEIKSEIEEDMEEMEGATADRYADLKLKIENHYEKLSSKVQKIFN